MKKIIIFLMILISTIISLSFGNKTYAKSYMSDKTEIPVNLEVSGAEALCQTDDGFVWIAQYSGLVRYDSKEFKTYKSFEYKGEQKEIINVRALQSLDNVLYIATSSSLICYRDNEFSLIEIEDIGIIYDILLDKDRNLLYVCTDKKGLIVYDPLSKTASTTRHTDGKTCSDVAIHELTGDVYYQLPNGIYNQDGDAIYLYDRILDIYSYKNTLYIGQDNGIIHRYDMVSKKFLDDIVVPDEINKMLYSPDEQILFVACEQTGLYCIDLSGDEPNISLAGNLDNKSQIVDLMIDYEGNLWLASHYIGASGVSIITKNDLLELLYDDQIWQELKLPPDYDRNVYAVKRYKNILYIVAATHIYLYDMELKKILPDNIIMEKINEYAQIKTDEGKLTDEKFVFKYGAKDVEILNGIIYFAVNNIGLIEYNPETEEVNIYDLDYILDEAHQGTLTGDPQVTLANALRCLRSFDDYLVIGYSRGIMKFKDHKFSIIAVPTNVLYINKTNDGKVLFSTSGGLFVIEDDFATVNEFETEKSVKGNRLKFLVEGNSIYYCLNSRLFKTTKEGNTYTHKEILLHSVKGSIVELSKIKFKDLNGNYKEKYVIGTQTQIYIADSLDVDKLDEYEYYDSTNGLQPIIANTSGYYDQDEQKYYFQSTNGIFVYDFNEKKDVSKPIKMTISAVDLDGRSYYGDNIIINKDVYRVSFNLSIFGFSPNNGYTIYYKLDGIDSDYISTTDDNRSINYTNLAGGEYKFHVYAVDEYGQLSNSIEISLIKEKQFYEQVWFWVIISVIAIAIIVALNFLLIKLKTRNSLRRQLQLKNITVEAIQAIARTIDAKDEYTNGHSIRVGYYSKIIAEHLHLSHDEVDNIYYIALLHDIGKIAIPDNILNKPGRLTDEEFAIMKSHTTRGAKILNGISTIPQIIEGAKSHHEKYDGTGYPEGLRGEFIPYVARIICCADCFDAMASKRVYKEPFPLEKIIGEFERCSGTQFDPHIAKVVVDLIKSGKLKPYTAENTYLGADGKTHRMKKEDVDKMNQKEAE